MSNINNILLIINNELTKLVMTGILGSLSINTDIGYNCLLQTLKKLEVHDSAKLSFNKTNKL
jgi:hypothetical protein